MHSPRFVGQVANLPHIASTACLRRHATVVAREESNELWDKAML